MADSGEPSLGDRREIGYNGVAMQAWKPVADLGLTTLDDQMTEEYRGGLSFMAGMDRPGPGPLRTYPPPPRIKTPWAARGGALDRLLVELGCPAVRPDIRASLKAYCRAMTEDRPNGAIIMDLLRTCILGEE